MKIAFIGFGEAARAFTESLRARDGRLRFTAFDIDRGPDMAAAMKEKGVRNAADPADALDGADWIVSAVTADQSLDAARAAAPSLAGAQVFLDINSVSPERKRETGALVAGAGAAYIDMAVMAPVHPRGHGTPTLIAGETASELVPELEALGFSCDLVGPDPGAATAVKMVRSLFVKGLEAITVEALLAAAASGCFDRVYRSLAQSYPGLGWPEHAAYTFERTLRHGTRRAAEMQESAQTLDALGLTGDLARRIAEVQAAMGAAEASELAGGDLAAAIAGIARVRGAG